MQKVLSPWLNFMCIDLYQCFRLAVMVKTDLFCRYPCLDNIFSPSCSVWIMLFAYAVPYPSFQTKDQDHSRFLLITVKTPLLDPVQPKLYLILPMFSDFKSSFFVKSQGQYLQNSSLQHVFYPVLSPWPMFHSFCVNLEES